MTVSQDIADAFADYYASLHRLSEDPNNPIPNSSAISAILDRLHFLLIASSELSELNSPFTEQQVISALYQKVNPRVLMDSLMNIIRYLIDL